MSKKIISAILTLVLLLSCTACSGVSSSTGSSSTVYTGTDGNLIVHFIDVGQGDCEFIELPNGETILIDAGETDQGETVVTYLENLEVETINYVIATHPHSDHIGGFPEVFEAFQIETVYMPDATSDTYAYENLLDSIEAEGCDVISATAGMTITEDSDLELTVNIIAPISDSYDDANNYSVVTKIEYCYNSFIFMGDAEESVEEEILASGVDVSADVIKVGHHGSKTSSSEAFVNAVCPVYAVIEVGEDNSYGHPHEVTLETYDSVGAKVYRTDESGSIIIESDGQTLTATEVGTVEATSSDDEVETYLDENGDPVPVETQTTTITIEVDDEDYGDDDDDYKWVLNTNSKKIHTPDCEYGQSMSDSNREYSNSTVAELEAEGYSPCKSCNPSD